MPVFEYTKSYVTFHKYFIIADCRSDVDEDELESPCAIAFAEDGDCTEYWLEEVDEVEEGYEVVDIRKQRPSFTTCDDEDSGSMGDAR